MRKVLALGVIVTGWAVVYVFERIAGRLHDWDEDDWQGIEDQP